VRIVLFGNAPTNNAGVRYRLVKFAGMLTEEGHRCVVCLPSSVKLWQRLWDRGNLATKLLYVLLAACRRAIQLRHVPRADVVFLRGSLMPYGYGPPLLEHIVHWLNPRMVFDIDDAVWAPPAGVTSPFLRLVDLNWAWKMCDMCVHGIVGNEYLLQHVVERNPHVTIIPTCVDMTLHRPKTYEKAEDSPVILGWTGLHTNLAHMDLIADVLLALAQEHRIALQVASDRPYQLDGIEVINRRWRQSDETEYLQVPDIGLMPLADSERARGKCAFKALQFMGVGTPCVVSPVGMNATIIDHGVNGFLANSPQEWHDTLTRLITDPQLRQRMGMAARRTVEERYSHQCHYPAFRQVMDSAARAELT
jgi:glycosyltransferase involved in cell wall biosynthesis